MNSKNCLIKSRKQIPMDVRRSLMQDAGFSCSICGKIPVVIHHIEEWAKHYSNDARHLIVICDTCHRRIHGEGGCFFSKEDLYKRKQSPQKPKFLKDKLPFQGQKSYFAGCNFVEDGERTGLIGLPGGHHLVTIDTSGGILRLSILAKIDNNIPEYLIQDNELIIDTEEMWDLSYSGSAIKIWKKVNTKKTLFIEIIVQPDMIILKHLNTTINGKSFRIYKPRLPNKCQIDKLRTEIKCLERTYNKYATEIEKMPQKLGIYRGIDYDAMIKQTHKDKLKTDIERYLLFEFGKNFKWPWQSYFSVLQKIMDESSLFKKDRDSSRSIHGQVKEIYDKVESLKKKYARQFGELNDTILEYNGIILAGTMVLFKEK